MKVCFTKTDNNYLQLGEGLSSSVKPVSQSFTSEMNILGGKANRKKGSHGLHFLSAFHENVKPQGNFPSVVLYHRADYGTRQHEAASPSLHWGSISVAWWALCATLARLCAKVSGWQGTSLWLSTVAPRQWDTVRQETSVLEKLK